MNQDSAKSHVSESLPTASEDQRKAPSESEKRSHWRSGCVPVCFLLIWSLTGLEQEFVGSKKRVFMNLMDVTGKRCLLSQPPCLTSMDRGMLRMINLLFFILSLGLFFLIPGLSNCKRTHVCPWGISCTHSSFLEKQTPFCCSYCLSWLPHIEEKEESKEERTTVWMKHFVSSV